MKINLNNQHPAGRFLSRDYNKTRENEPASPALIAVVIHDNSFEGGACARVNYFVFRQFLITYLLLDAELLLAVVAGVAARAAVAAVAVEGGGVEPVEPAAPRAHAAGGHDEEDGHLRQQHLRAAPAQHSHPEHLKQTEEEAAVE